MAFESRLEESRAAAREPDEENMADVSRRRLPRNRRCPQVRRDALTLLGEPAGEFQCRLTLRVQG